MRRGPKPAKSKEAKPPTTRKSPKDEDSKVRDLEKRLAEALRDKAEALEQQPPPEGEGAVGRVAQTREPVQIADISDPAAYESRVRNGLLQIGCERSWPYRSSPRTDW